MKEAEFKELLKEQLADIVCIETKSKKIIEQLKEAAKNNAVSSTIDAQIKTSEGNLGKVNNEATRIDFTIPSSDCETIKAIIKKTALYLEEGPVNDPGILSHLNRINQYKLAIYNSAVRFSRELKYNSMYLTLQNITNHEYNLSDRLARLDNQQSDESTIENL